MSKSLLQSIKDGDVRVVETTRSEVRALQDHLPEDGLGDKLMGELDEAQGEADAPGKVVYVVLQIAGESL